MDVPALKPVSSPTASPAVSGERPAPVVPAVPHDAPAPVVKAADLAPDPEAVQRTAEQIRQQMAAVAQQLRDYAQSNSRDLEFSVDEQSDRTVITVRNAATGEVVRQIPDQELLDLQRRLNVGQGTLVDSLV